MGLLKAHKVVSVLPGALEADALYLVRVGAGFALYATNSLGAVVAYSLNQPTTVTPQTTVLDFGGAPVSDKSFTVTDGSATANSIITASIIWLNTLGRDADELMADPIIVAIKPGNGNFTVLAQARLGNVTGKYGLAYHLA